MWGRIKEPDIMKDYRRLKKDENKSVFLNYDKSVYVGEIDDFHRLFEVEEIDVRENHGLSAIGGFCVPRLWDLYRKILKYI